MTDGDDHEESAPGADLACADERSLVHASPMIKWSELATASLPGRL
jgi:hypothetical protein